MKAGDLVKIKYDDRVKLVTKVEIEPLEHDINRGTWIHLLGEDITFRKEHLEVLSASR
jgi:hypothetical protein